MTSALPRDAERSEQSWFARWRESACPPPEVLQPSLEGMLPETVARLVRAHLDRCALCRALVDAMADDEVAAPGAEELARIDAGVHAGTVSHRRNWTLYAAAAAVVLAAGAGLLAWSMLRTAPNQVAGSDVPLPPPPSPAVEPAPEFALALQRPEIELPPESLTLRSDAPDRYAAALERALVPFARADYQAAIGRLEPLVRDYPAKAHPAYYLALARLLAGSPNAAIPELRQARKLAGPAASLYPEATWYLAVALERSGQRDSAVGALMELCGAGGSRDTQACDGLRSLTAAR